ncbi:MAG: hypothetical protein GY725_24985 [bacterium]|nr:hypothetical protein [bacterium]
MEVDGETAQIQRFADLELRSLRDESGTLLVELFLNRYYTRVEGAPGGTTELSISARGLSTQTPQEGSQSLGPEAASPGGGTISQLRERPVAGVGLVEGGFVSDELWQSSHPVLFGIHLLDWLLLALPTEPGRQDDTWTGSREVPQMGQYRVGIELPLLYRPSSGAEPGVQVSGSVRRKSLRIAQDFEGALELDHVARAVFSPDGALADATLELRMSFTSSQGSRVSSRHRVRIRRLNDQGEINPDAEEADTPRAT